MTVHTFLEQIALNKIIQVVLIAVICDTFFGILRAIKEHRFNSSVGIDGAIRKVGMLASLVFLSVLDIVYKINLIAFVPEDIRAVLSLETVGITELFSLCYLAYEFVSVLKNMALCGLPVKRLWSAVRKFLSKYTDELPDADELGASSTIDYKKGEQE